MPRTAGTRTCCSASRTRAGSSPSTPGGGRRRFLPMHNITSTPGSSTPSGIAFSNLDDNLWHATARRATDQTGADTGHAVDQSFDGSRLNQAPAGNASLYFGYEGPLVQTQFGTNNFAPNTTANTYDFPGGAGHPDQQSDQSRRVFGRRQADAVLRLLVGHGAGRRQRRNVSRAARRPDAGRLPGVYLGRRRTVETAQYEQFRPRP